MRGADEGPAGLFGPFRDRRAAEKARDALHRLFPLRPCDYAFEPDPALPLGLGCLYAQVRSCAAPCLARVSEEEYRALAARAAAWLGRPGGEDAAPAAVPAIVSAVDVARARGRRRGAKGDRPLPGARAGACSRTAAVDRRRRRTLEAAVAGSTGRSAGGPDDWPWLAAWLRSPRGRASYVLAGDVDDRRRSPPRVRAALPARFAAPAPGGNVGATQGEA